MVTHITISGIDPKLINGIVLRFQAYEIKE